MMKPLRSLNHRDSHPSGTITSRLKGLRITSHKQSSWVCLRMTYTPTSRRSTQTFELLQGGFPIRVVYQCLS
jgi:hypothetical protein